MRRPVSARLSLGIALAMVLGLGALSGVRAQSLDELQDADKAFDAGDLKKAARKYDDAIKKYPSQVSAEAYGKRAFVYFLAKDYANGLKFVTQKAEVQYPGSPDVLEPKALILWAMGSKPDAIRIAEEVVGKRPEKFSNQALIGEFYAGREPEKAATAYEKYFEHRPESLESGDVLPRIRLGFSYLGRAQRTKDDAGATLTGEAKESVLDALGRAEKQFDILLRKHRKRTHAEVNANNGLCATYTWMGELDGGKSSDRAITVCEQIIQNPRNIDKRGSVWLNLGIAYLRKKQPRRARTAGNEYVRLSRNDARGYLVVGESYFQEREFERALEYYLDAQKRARPDEQVEVSKRLGLTYTSKKNPDYAKAIEQLTIASTSQPKNVELAVSLGSAYLATGDDAKALSSVDRLISAAEFDKTPDDDKASLLLVAGKALYNQANLKDARARYELAYSLKKSDVQVRIGLVQTVNLQAYQAMEKSDYKSADALLGEAMAFDNRAAITRRNLAVLSIHRGDCDGGRKQLSSIKGRQGYSLVYHRLMGRTYLCGKKRDEKKAMEHFAKADEEARKAGAVLVQAEIYVEWAPLLVDTKLDDAVEKLQSAVQFSSQDAAIGAAAKRNLALALYRRGWRSMKANKASDAVADFERATREPALLQGTEPLAFEFSLAMAQLDVGNTAAAAKSFKELAAKGKTDSYLKAPYNKSGTAFFGAYADYRGGTTALRLKAAKSFSTMLGGASGAYGNKIKELIASSWEFVAYDQFKAGNGTQANASMNNAAKYASADIKRNIDHNRAVIGLTKASEATFEAMNGNPPESLVNLGILYDRAGKSKEAYDTWVRAQKRGVGSRDLQKWIDAKKRIFGY